MAFYDGEEDFVESRKEQPARLDGKCDICHNLYFSGDRVIGIAWAGGSDCWAYVHAYCARGHRNNRSRNSEIVNSEESVQNLDDSCAEVQHKFFTSGGLDQAIKRGEVPNLDFDKSRPNTGRYRLTLVK